MKNKIITNQPIGSTINFEIGKKEMKEKIIEIMEENWVFTARYNRKKDIDSERRRVAKEILELLDQDKQKLIGEIEIARQEEQKRCIEIIRNYHLGNWAGEGEVYEELDKIILKIEMKI